MNQNYFFWGLLLIATLENGRY